MKDLELVNKDGIDHEKLNEIKKLFCVFPGINSKLTDEKQILGGDLVTDPWEKSKIASNELKATIGAYEYNYYRYQIALEKQKLAQEEIQKMEKENEHPSKIRIKELELEQLIAEMHDSECLFEDCKRRVNLYGNAFFNAKAEIESKGEEFSHDNFNKAEKTFHIQRLIREAQFQYWANGSVDVGFVRNAARYGFRLEFNPQLQRVIAREMLTEELEYVNNPGVITKEQFIKLSSPNELRKRALKEVEAFKNKDVLTDDSKNQGNA